MLVNFNETKQKQYSDKKVERNSDNELHANRCNLINHIMNCHDSQGTSRNIEQRKQEQGEAY